MPSDQVSSILQLERFQIGRCSGSNRDGNPCNNRVSKDSCGQAARLLPSILDKPANDTQTKERLKGLAELLLCKRWHRCQSTRLASGWREMLHAREARLRTVVVNAPSRHSQHIHERRDPAEPSLVQPSPRDNSLPTERRQTRAYTRMMREIMESSMSAEEKVRMVSIAITLMESTSSSDTQDGPQATEPETHTRRGRSRSRRSYSRHSDHEDQSASQSRQPSRSGSIRSLSTRSPSPAPSEEPESMHTRIGLFSTRTSMTETPHRASHEECGICQDTYGEDEEFWQCTQCDNRTHADCFRSWAGARTLDATCIYCRIPVL